MIDIIIPIYNGRKTIRRTLDSIYNQDIYEKIKVYVIDDGSSETYEDILSEYENKINIEYKKIQNNMGPGNARNYGLKIADNEYVFFIDADDELCSKDSLNKLYKAISTNNHDIVRSTIFEKGLNGSRIIKNWNISLHGKIYRNSFLKNNKICFIDSYSNEDMAFNLDAKLHGAIISDIDDITYIWNYNKDSIYRKNADENRIKDFYDIVNNTLKMLTKAVNERCNIELLETAVIEQLIQIFIRWVYIDKSKVNIDTIKKIYQICNIFIQSSHNKVEEIICKHKLIDSNNQQDFEMFYKFLLEMNPNFTKEKIK